MHIAPRKQVLLPNSANETPAGINDITEIRRAEVDYANRNFVQSKTITDMWFDPRTKVYDGTRIEE